MSWFDRFKKTASSDEPAAAPAAPPKPQPKPQPDRRAEGSVPQRREPAPATGPAAPAAGPRPAPPPRRLAVTIPLFVVGDRVAGMYALRRLVDASGAWSVFEATHEPWNVPVALKVPKTETLPDTEAPARVQAAAAAWSGLGVHANVAYCHGAHVVDGIPLVVCDWVPGCSLQEWAANAPPGDTARRLKVAIGVLSALEYAHSRGVTHGGLVPQNILVGDDDVPRVTDFRVPKRADAAVDGYVAPEVWAAPREAAVAADVFGVGACLHALFAGAPPYETTRGEPGARTAISDASGLSAALRELLGRCVAWQAGERPQTVAEIRRALVEECRSVAGEASFPEPGALADVAAAENRRALGCLVLGNVPDAEAHWAKALEAEASHVHSAANLAMTQWRAGSLSGTDVLARIDALVVAGDEAWIPAYLRAVVRLESGEPADSLVALDALLQQWPGRAEIERARELAVALSGGGGACRVLEGHDQYVSCVDVSRDATWAISGSDDGSLRLWDLETGACARVWQGHEQRVACVSFTADGRGAVTGSDDRTVRVWDLQSGECTQTVNVGTGRVFAAALSRDGKTALIAASADETLGGVEETNLQLWNMTANRRQRGLEGHDSPVKTVALSADGRWAVSGSDDKTVRLWDTMAARCLRVFEGHTHYVSAVTLSTDKKRIVSASWDRTVRVWDTGTGECVQTLEGHTNMVNSTGVSSDGRVAVSGGWDKVIQLWDAVGGQCLRSLEGHSGLVTSVALSPDGRRAVSGSWDKTVRVWDLPNFSGWFSPPLL